MMLGKGAMQSIARKQKMNMRSSTEGELIAVDNAAAMILWTELFLEAHLGEIAYNSNKTKMYIMSGYVEEMAGTKIPDGQLVKPKKGRFITKYGGENWTCKSMDRCLKYGICQTCLGSRPSGMHCQICRMKNKYYECPWTGNLCTPMKWIDAEWNNPCASKR
jgi:hypothetical protein